MNRDRLFEHFEKLNEHEKIQLLKDCFNTMNTQQNRHVFGGLENIYIGKNHIKANAVLKEIQKFKKDSLQGLYYAPFMINSKNYMDVPEKTRMWFEKLAELLLESAKLSQQCDHAKAIECFNLLFECIDIMESNEEIIFAHEYGMWMLPIHEEPYIEAYIHSAATLLKPEKYVEMVLPLIRRDSKESCYNKVYEKACHFANKEQKHLLMRKNAYPVKNV